MEEKVTLEKIDMIRSRTNASFKEAKEALEKHEGNVIEALIELEEKKQNSKWTDEISVKSSEVVDKVKDLIREGNVNRIRIKSEDKILAEIPVSLGAIGAVLAPQIAALGVLAAVFKKCSIEVVRNDDIVDVEPTEETKERQEE